MTARRPVRGFTLIEALLVTMIVFLLIALLAPSLVGARKAGLHVATLANLRSSVQVFTDYAGEHRDSLPAYFDPVGTRAFLRYAGGVSEIPGYFYSPMFWPFALADSHLGGNPYSASAYDAEQSRHFGAPSGAPLLPSCTIFAQPEYWDPATRVTGTSQWRSVRVSDILHPARKIMFVSPFPFLTVTGSDDPMSGEPLTPARPIPIGTTDGGAAAPPRDAIRPGVPTGENQPPHFADFFAGLHTEHGVRGWDLP